MAENVAAVTEKQLVVFDLAGEHYGVDIATVREIIQMQTVTRVPGSASFVEGLINLRGVVIPVVDLRRRFGLESTEHDKDTRIMVIHCEGQDIGMVVDSVTEVLRIQSDSIVPPSSLIMTANSKYLLGIVKLPDRLVVLLDTERVLSHEDQSALAKMAAREETGGKARRQEHGATRTAAVASPEEAEGPTDEKVLASEEASPAPDEEKVPVEEGVLSRA